MLTSPKTPMNDRTPQYVVVLETSGKTLGQWRFVLRPADGSPPIEAADVEPDVWGERLDLLTVVRALESLDQPSRVTLVGCTRYVEQGILYGLRSGRRTAGGGSVLDKWCPCGTPTSGNGWIGFCNSIGWSAGGGGSTPGTACPTGRIGTWLRSGQKLGGWPRRGRKWVKYHALALAAWCGLGLGISDWGSGSELALA